MASLLEGPHFPTLEDLPDYDDLDLRYYEEGGYGYLPSIHWAFLGEIIEAYHFFRPRFIVRDRTGLELPVHLHLDDEDKDNFDQKQFFKKGYTLCMYYASRRNFMDGTIGVRAEVLSHLALIPCPLNVLLSVNTADVDSSTACYSCAKEKENLLKCSKCGTRYCGKDCQVQDWKEKKHKERCAAIRQVRDWQDRDWSNFHNFWF